LIDMHSNTFLSHEYEHRGFSSSGLDNQDIKKPYDKSIIINYRTAKIAIPVILTFSGYIPSYQTLHSVSSIRKKHELSESQTVYLGVYTQEKSTETIDMNKSEQIIVNRKDIENLTKEVQDMKKVMMTKEDGKILKFEIIGWVLGGVFVIGAAFLAFVFYVIFPQVLDKILAMI